ncbi:MAG: hypothetical protein EBW73_03415, partial [Betaproteobacteria bacterium]|nr:hypothetical protein [Betaproteobacteria bacterium]
MLQHPVFTPIIRRWGMALRVIGISREAMAYDFRALLSDSTLAKLRSALRDDPQQAPVDLIYQALAQGMLTRLHPSGQMAKHLLREGYIHPNSEAIEPADSAHRPLLIKALQTALRRGQLDIGSAPEAAGFTVLGMGKLGAGELNYSSDIDLILLYDRDAAALAGNDQVSRHFVRGARLLVQLMSET